MDNSLRKATVLIAATLVTASVAGQQIANPGFKSVGRGAPLAADLRDREITGATIPVQFGPNGADPRPEQFHRCGAQRCGTARCRAAARRHLHIEGFLQGSRTLDRSRVTSAATARSRIEELWGANSSAVIGDNPPASGAWGYCDRDYPREAHREPVPLQDGAGALRGVARGDDQARRRWEEPERRATRDWTGRYAHPGNTTDAQADWTGRDKGTTPAVLLVPNEAQPVHDDPVAADARVSEAHGARGLSPGEHERAAVAVAVLLARRLHAPLARVRRVGVALHRRALGRADRDRRGAQLHHDDPRRPRVQDSTATYRAWARMCRAGTARRSASGTGTR